MNKDWSVIVDNSGPLHLHRFANHAVPVVREPSSLPVAAFQLTLVPPGQGFGFLAREFLDSSHRDAVRHFGGSCRGSCNDGRVAGELRAPAGVVHFYLDGLVKCIRKNYLNGFITLTIDENPGHTLTPAEESIAASFDTSPFQLARAVYMKLPDGAFLASNVWSSFGRPSFAEPVVEHANRAAQWNRIKAAGADQRLCRVFPCESDYRDWQNAMLQNFALKAPSSLRCAASQQVPNL